MIIDLLKKGNYTNQEQAVVNFIFENPEVILQVTAKSLATLTYVSAPTIIRLVKKLGFAGYPEFQLAYAKEYSQEKNNAIVPLTQNSSLSQIMEALPQIYSQVFQETNNIINKAAFIRTINYVLQADNIDFYANDNNHHVIQSACLKLNSLGFHAQAFNTINDHYIDSLNPKTAIAFIVSHTGDNQTMLDNARYLKAKGIRSIALTGYLYSKLGPLCNETLCIDLHVYPVPKELHLYGVSIFYILDVLITALALKKKK